MIVKWRDRLREAEVIEIRRTRLKSRLRLDDGSEHVIDRPANEVQLPAP